MDSPDTILGTSITWNEFELYLRTSLGTEARFGPNKSVNNIGEGKGFASICGLVKCDWNGLSEGENFPDTVVIKIPSILPLRSLNDSLPQERKTFNFDDSNWVAMQKGLLNRVSKSNNKYYKIHNRELVTYEFFNQFENLPIPQKYYGIKAEENLSGQLCVEYIDNSITMQFYENYRVNQLKEIARALGKIQASSLKKVPTAHEFQFDFFGSIAKGWPLDKFRAHLNSILEFDSSDKIKYLMTKINELIPTYHSSNLASTVHEKLGFRPVLVNGDVHTTNVLIAKDDGRLLALIDWQLTHLGVGVEDLHRIALSALSTEDRRACLPLLIEEMYTSLLENLDGAVPPFSLETQFTVSDLVYPQCAFFFALTIITQMQKTNKDSEIANEEKKNRRIEVQLKKLVGALEDIVDLDDKNKKTIEHLDLKSCFAVSCNTVLFV